MGNSLLASPLAGIKSNGPRKLLAKTVAAVAIAVFWCISAVGTTVGTAVGTTVGVTTLAPPASAPAPPTPKGGGRGPQGGGVRWAMTQGSWASGQEVRSGVPLLAAWRGHGARARRVRESVPSAQSPRRCRPRPPARRHPKEKPAA